MSSNIHPRAGQLPQAQDIIDLGKLADAYFGLRPDPSIPAQRVTFGTSGHRGSALRSSFNEAHVLAISQAICLHRQAQGIDGPLFIGIDTHALSQPAFESALEVLVANGVEVRIAVGTEYTPTPAISLAILNYNRGRSTGLADGIVITPSHNPPEDGGFKYNPPNGGPADTNITSAVEAKANEFLEANLIGVKRLPYAQARKAANVREHDFLSEYVGDLSQVIDFDVIRTSGIRLGVDPLGGAGVDYWPRIAQHYKLDLTIVNPNVDKTFKFMTLDWDGRIRMDPSSPYAMRSLIALQHQYDIAFACDTDHDRHGIVAPSVGLMPPNNYLAVAIDYLFQHRPHWSSNSAVGKTLVSSALIDRVANKLGRRLCEVPVGFKWFVDGLTDKSLGFGGEESAGATFNRMDGSVWTTDKDGLSAALLSAEMTARTGRDPGQLYQALTQELGLPTASRVDAPATPAQKKKLSKLSPQQITISELAGEKITQIMDRAPANDAAIGGIKVMTANGWFAARPSGTEDIYKIYAESFLGETHLNKLLLDAQQIVDKALAE
ncbi:MAG TPA: phosphoglucomutase (alpha-D-glucose-1,6-bisphosphate-dependent) [Rhodocyclaceae bacterium]|nr:phosphoglucomutase (alpha-D-glucose-1,6-bisphosphate-dependent) [Rhodocyclaceae bacterium]